MKIAHVTATFPPYQGGTGNVCYYNALELGKLGHQVTVFTAAHPPGQYTYPAAFEVRRLPVTFRIGNAPLLPGLLGIKDFDIIHLHYPFIFGAELVRLAALIRSIPFIITHHNDLIGDGARAKLFANYQLISAWTTVRHARYVCAVSLDHYNSSNLRASMNGNGPPAFEIPNGVDTDLFSPAGATDVRERYQIPHDAKLALFVAALDRAHHFKGLEQLLRAMKSLDDTTWLLIAGDGDLRAEYERQAEALGISRRTVFAGAIDHDQLPPFFRAADVTVLPSSPPESFGLVLIESMACGIPVIASDIPGVRTVVADGIDGYLVAEGDVAALSDRLRDMLALPDAHQAAMGQAGRRKVEERYAWEQIGARLEEVYRDVLRQASGMTKAIPSKPQERMGEN